MLRNLLLIFVTLSAVLIFACEIRHRSVIITLDLGTTFQTITGREVSACCKSGPRYNYDFPKYLDELLNSVVNDLGMNVVRLGTGCGHEKTENYFSQWSNGQTTEYKDIHNR